MIKEFLTGVEDDSPKHFPRYVRYLGGGGGGDGGAAAAEANRRKREEQHLANIGKIRGVIRGGPYTVNETQDEMMARVNGALNQNQQRTQALQAQLDDIERQSRVGGLSFEEERRLNDMRNSLQGQMMDLNRTPLSNSGAFSRELRPKTINQGGPTQEDRLNQTEQTVLDFLFPRLQEQEDRAGRDLKFELLRRGTAAGSAGIDARKEFQRRGDRARESVATKGLQARDDVRARDARLESGLISQALSGVGQDALIGQALSGIDANATAAQNAAKDANLDNFFSNAGNLFSASQQAQGFGAGQDAVAQLLFGNQNRTSFNADPTKAKAGTVTRTFN